MYRQEDHRVTLARINNSFELGKLKDYSGLLQLQADFIVLTIISIAYDIIALNILIVEIWEHGNITEKNFDMARNTSRW